MPDEMFVKYLSRYLESVWAHNGTVLSCCCHEQVVCSHFDHCWALHEPPVYLTVVLCYRVQVFSASWPNSSLRKISSKENVRRWGNIQIRFFFILLIIVSMDFKVSKLYVETLWTRLPTQILRQRSPDTSLFFLVFWIYCIVFSLPHLT